MIPIDKNKLDRDMMELTMDAVGALINGEHEKAEHYSSVLGWLKMLADIIREEEKKEEQHDTRNENK